MSDEKSAIEHAEARKATWFELFFDLVFVTAVAGLAGRFAEHYDLAGALSFAFLFLVLWWLWLGHTFHASRFDEDRPDQRVIGFAQMLAVVLIAYGSGDAFGARAAPFVIGIAAFKALLLISYLRSFRRRPEAARLAGLYSAIYGVQAALWLVSLGSRRAPLSSALPYLAIALATAFAVPFAASLGAMALVFACVGLALLQIMVSMRRRR